MAGLVGGDLHRPLGEDAAAAVGPHRDAAHCNDKTCLLILRNGLKGEEKLD